MSSYTLTTFPAKPTPAQLDELRADVATLTARFLNAEAWFDGPHDTSREEEAGRLIDQIVSEMGWRAAVLSTHLAGYSIGWDAPQVAA